MKRRKASTPVQTTGSEGRTKASGAVSYTHLDVYKRQIVEVFNGEDFARVEFCSAGSGGGRSPRTRQALIALMVAIEDDNKADVSGSRHHPRYGELFT